MEEFFENITTRSTTFKYLCCDNAGENQSKLKKDCEKEKAMSEYNTPNMR